MTGQPRRGHLALVVPSIEQIGGAERQVLLLAQALAARGWQITLIALSGACATAEEELKTGGVQFLSLAMRKAWIDPRGWLLYLIWSSQKRPEIVHAHLPHATWFTRWVRLLAPVRVVLSTLHTSRTPSPAKVFAYRTSEWLSDLSTCVSLAVSDSARAAGLLHPDKMATVIRNGVPLPHMEACNAYPRRLEGRLPFRWIAVGRLATVKDYPTLLQAIVKLCVETQSSPHLTIVGVGPEEENLRRLTDRLGLTDQVHFAGFHQDVQPLLAKADAFVLASLWEGLPVSLLEAQAAGLPVVVTDAAGSREAMMPGTTGLLVPIGSPAALSQAMGQVMAMPLADRLKMGNQARLFIQSTFQIPVIVEQWEHLYGNLLRDHPRPSRWYIRPPNQPTVQ